MFWGPDDEDEGEYALELAEFVLGNVHLLPALLWPRCDFPSGGLTGRHLGRRLARQLAQLTLRSVNEVDIRSVTPVDSAFVLPSKPGDLLLIQAAGSCTITLAGRGDADRLYRAAQPQPQALRLRRGEVLFVPQGWRATLHRDSGTRHVLLQFTSEPGENVTND